MTAATNNATPTTQGQIARSSLRELKFCRVNSELTPTRPSIVLVHGWGSGSWAWQPVQDQLCDFFNVWLLDLPGYGSNCDVKVASVDAFVSLFGDSLGQLPERFFLLGWSLGGALSSLIASQYSSRVRALVTVATAPSFIRRAVGEAGLDVSVFSQFRADLDDSPTRLLKRFSLLQSKGSEHFRQCHKFIQNNADMLDADCLEQGLLWLQEIDLHGVWPSLEVPTIHIYGKNDVLVSAETADYVAQCYVDHHVQLFDSAAHLPFFDEPDLFVKTVAGFFSSCGKEVASSGKRIDTPAVQRAFSRAAKKYDELANVQWRVANDLLGYLDVDAIRTELPEKPVVIDLGSGTGFLSRHFPSGVTNVLVQLDISEQMLQRAKQHRPADAGFFVQGDINRLPLRETCIDLAVSSLSLQWCDDLAALFSCVHHCLCDNGRFLFSTLLPGSVIELERASRALDTQPHVHEFIAASAIQQYAQSAGFMVSQFKEQAYVEKFESGRALLASVNGIGAGNHRLDRSGGLLGKQRYQRFIAALDDAADESGLLSLTYRVLFVELRK